ncbi:MAG: carboxylating nicotinate-nucleotide diphosphorylase [Clostridium sp.]|jgi:nicotinate-nucleotide pyrophosphorylase (carboxylating)|nr:carboxylating nicotinate-nucleotide diphosphorylase [Clostridium sp.]
MNTKLYDELLLAALREDMPFGDISSEAVFDEKHKSAARLLAKEDGVLCGIGLFRRIFELLGVPDENWELFFEDGDKIKKGDVLCAFSGQTRALLAGERTGLNILQHLSGIASQTAAIVKAVKRYNVFITETRKTLPGIRALQKYAVRVGGGRNHRFSLSDAVMLKDNHIDAAGGIASAVESVRKAVGHTVKVELETRSLDEVSAALEAGADIIMLDNMTPKEIRAAVALIDGKAITEASGGITADNVKEYAKTGVNVISLGALTHSVKALDISMLFNA